MHPFLGMALVLAALGGLSAGCRWYATAYQPHPEIARKSMHVALGLVTLSFPWLFDAPWPVITLAVLAVAALVAVRRVKVMRETVGEVIHGVHRESAGELVFPIAVAAVFTLAKGDAVLFVVPMLLLTLSDALAALIGVRYGMTHYASTEGTTKSIEGSAAFFLSAFLATHIALLLATDTGRAESLLIGLQMGLLMTLVEAVAWRGLDNLLVPLAGFALLKDAARRDLPELITGLVVLGLLALAISLWRRRTTLDTSGVVASVLVGFVTWTIGGVAWLAAPLAALASYALLWPPGENEPPPIHNAQAVLAVSAPGLAWLYASTRLPDVDFLYMSVTCYAIQLAMIGRAGAARPEGPAGGYVRIGSVSALGWLVAFVPYVFIERIAPLEALRAACALPVVAIAAVVFAQRYRWMGGDPAAASRWVMQALVGFGGSLLAIPAWLLL